MIGIDELGPNPMGGKRWTGEPQTPPRTDWQRRNEAPPRVVLDAIAATLGDGETRLGYVRTWTFEGPLTESTLEALRAVFGP